MSWSVRFHPALGFSKSPRSGAEDFKAADQEGTCQDPTLKCWVTASLSRCWAGDWFTGGGWVQVGTVLAPSTLDLHPRPTSGSSSVYFSYLWAPYTYPQKMHHKAFLPGLTECLKKPNISDIFLFFCDVILAWRIPGTKESGELLSIGLQRVRHYWSDLTHTLPQLYLLQDILHKLSR